jgi:hypothetical protein
MPSVVPIIQSLLGLLGTLAGTGWGAYLSRGKEERQWQRDQWLEIYADIVRVPSLLLVEGSRIYGNPDRDNIDANKLAELTTSSAVTCNGSRGTDVIAPTCRLLTKNYN